MTIKQQVERNLVAIVSLVVALAALGYNTWRNEQSEENRNLRTASVEVLLKLGELQEVVFRGHYDRDADAGNPRVGWAYVLTIQDMATVLPPKVTARGETLVRVWTEGWSDLGKEQNSTDAILHAMDALRSEVLAVVRSLN